MKKLFIILFCASTLSAAILKARMPLLANNLRSLLYADLDVSVVNEQIKDYIDSNVENQVNDTCRAKIEEFVNNKNNELKDEMLKDFSRNMNQTTDKYGYELYSIVRDVKFQSSRLLNDTKEKFDKFQKELSAVNSEWKENVLKQIKETTTNLIKENTELKENILDKTKELRIKLEELKQNSVFDRPVAVTSCVSRYGDISSGMVIKFEDVVNLVGFVGISQFMTTGAFTCEKAGLYLISVHIASKTSGAHFFIYKDSILLSRIVIADHPSHTWDFTGTGIVTIELQNGDRVWVQTGSNNFFASGNRWSCMSVVKIK